jgi:hypothetical protein
MMDYEAVSPPAIDEAYARITPAYREVFCGIGAGAMRFAKQLFWQESAFPAEFARAKTEGQQPATQGALDDLLQQPNRMGPTTRKSA